MRAKFISENLNKTPYSYYDLANALDVSKAILPILREKHIKFEYDSYSNFLKVFPIDLSQAQMAKNIILYDGDGDTSNEPRNGDGAIIIESE